MVLDRVATGSAPATPAVEPTATTIVRAHDGTRLATDIHLPSAGRQDVPCTTLLLRTPYGKRGTIDRIAELAPHLTAAGIAVVAQDVRGKFASGGDIVPFVHELADGHATAQWISEQPWSNGAIVPFGDSYAGFTSWATAASRHPTVLAAIVRVTTGHLPDEWMYRQGVFRLQQNAQWATFAWGGHELLDVRPDWSARPLGSGDGDGADTANLMAWLGAAPHSLRWPAEILAHQPPLSRLVRVPVLHWGGWWDLMARGQVREWQHLTRNGNTDQVLVMEATDHSFNHFSCVDGAPPATSFEHQYGSVVDFLSAAGDGALAERQSPVRWELAHDGWHDDDTWPPREGEPDRLFLADGASAAFGLEGGALSLVPDSVPITLGIPHDPADLVPSLETWVWGTLANDYPDERDVHVRPDVMTFTGTPAGEPVDLVGPARLRLALRPPPGGAQITANLSDVHPDGRALRIAEGAAELDGGDGDDEAGGGGAVIDLGPLGYRVRPGHRLRLALAASAFPRYLWHGADRLAAWHSAGGAPHEISLRLDSNCYLETNHLRRR